MENCENVLPLVVIINAVFSENVSCLRNDCNVVSDVCVYLVLVCFFF